MGSLVLGGEKRHQERIIFTRSVRVYGQEGLLGEFATRNLSISGLFLCGDIPLPVNTRCQLELLETGQYSHLLLSFTGIIIRHEGDGVAVEFIHMEHDSFMFLQTMILYYSDNPLGVAEHFLEEFIARPLSSA